LQNEVINYSPLQLNAFALVADLCGGSGTAFVLFLQKRWRFSIMKGVFYGACMTLIPCVSPGPVTRLTPNRSIWGIIGCYTKKVGFHNSKYWSSVSRNLWLTRYRMGVLDFLRVEFSDGGLGLIQRHHDL